MTRTLLALNVAVFAVEVFGSVHQGGFGSFSSSELLRLGASYPPATIGEHRWETLITACFLHGGLLHIGFNMIALWQAGPLVEQAVGSARMAPLYLVSGIAGNALSVGHAWATRATAPSVGASGAISGVIAAALVVGWRVQGWRGPLTQAMARWLGFVIAFGLLSNLSGASIDNAAHIGGALAGAVIALTWRRGYRYTPAATGVILGACGAVLLAAIGVLAWRDNTDFFASMTLADRAEYTRDAVGDGRCRDAEEGLRAVERLRGRAAPVVSLRDQVEGACGKDEGW